MGAKRSQVLMVTPSGFKHMFEKISDAATFANANAWTMSLKMQVMGYFEDNKGNKYYRQTAMQTKNEYTTTSPKTTRIIKKHKRTVVRKKTPVIVDGVRYDSVSEAEVRCGFKRDTLGQALRHGQKTSKGHTIAYAEANAMEAKMPIVDIKPTKEEKISILIDSEDPAIKAINKEIVEILKKANVYDEIKSLAKAIQKLSK